VDEEAKIACRRTKYYLGGEEKPSAVSYGRGPIFKLAGGMGRSGLATGSSGAGKVRDRSPDGRSWVIIAQPTEGRKLFKPVETPDLSEGGPLGPVASSQNCSLGGELHLHIV